MTQKETLDKAYGSIPKEVTGDFDFFSAFPVPRSLKYYWYKLIRKVTRQNMERWPNGKAADC